MGYRRVKLGDTRSEIVVDLSNLHRSVWSGITPDNIPIFSRDISSDEISALESTCPKEARADTISIFGVGGC